MKTIEPIQEAVTAYATRAAEKLRQQGSLCRQIRVSLRTGMFNPTEAKYANGLLCQLPYTPLRAALLEYCEGLNRDMTDLMNTLEQLAKAD